MTNTSLIFDSPNAQGPIMIQADEAAAEPKNADEAIAQAANGMIFCQYIKDTV